MNKNFAAEKFPSTSTARKYIKEVITCPVVFHNKIKLWSIPWTISDWIKEYGEITLNFRVVDKTDQGVSWENEGSYVKASILQFFRWNNEGEFCNDDLNNPLNQVNPNQCFAYSSYNYMNKVFPISSDILKNVGWEVFGFPELTGSDSTFWLGSEGSYTPCHFDTYGCNLVAQVLGRKKWILFPPEDTPYMYPSRIPYEESSVFSSVDIQKPDFTTHPLFQKSHPYVVVLEPGDVLFVPKKWWHFVISLDCKTASINTWIKLNSDADARLEESVAKALMSSFINFYEPEDKSWLNPLEVLPSPNESLTYIHSTLNELAEKNVRDQKHPSLSKKAEPPLTLDKLLKYEDVSLVDRAQCEKSYIVKLERKPSLKEVVDCFVHPDVLSVVCRLLKEF